MLNVVLPPSISSIFDPEYLRLVPFTTAVIFEPLVLHLGEIVWKPAIKLLKNWILWMLNDAEWQISIAATPNQTSPIETLFQLNSYKMFTFQLPDAAKIVIYLSALFNIYGSQYFSPFLFLDCHTISPRQCNTV